MNSHDQALYELMSERYDGLQADCGALRASLHDLEKRHEEAKLALEVARRERDEAKAWKVEYMRQVAEKDEQVAEVHLLLFKAEADRDAALTKLDHLRRFADELGKDDTPVLMGFSHYLHAILDAPNRAAAAALKRLEEATDAH